jgi:hypothetical protein
MNAMRPNAIFPHESSGQSIMMGMRWNMLRSVMLCAIMLLSLGCETYRVEYHSRPAFYRQAAAGELSDRVQLDDGTVIVYREHDPQRTHRREVSQPRRQAEESNGEERRQFKIREDKDDGSVVLRALMPEHVLANFITCLQEEEYELLYHQLLSKHTRRAWEAEGNTVEDFEDYFAQHRAHMIRTANLIFLGLTSHETQMIHDGPDVIELRLLPQYSRDLRFRRIRMIMEDDGMKLINIR